MKKSLVMLLLTATLVGGLVGCGTATEQSTATEGALGKKVHDTAADLGEHVIDGVADKVDLTEETTTPDEDADLDAASYWDKHADDMWYGGNFAIYTDQYIEGVPSTFRCESGSDGYFMFQLSVSDSFLSIANVNGTNYVVTEEKNYKFESPEGETPSVLSTDDLKEVVTNMQYTETVDGKDVFDYSKTSEEGTEISYRVYADRAVGGVTSIDQAGTILQVEKLDKRTFDGEALEGFEEFPADMDANEFITRRILTMMVLDDMLVEPEVSTPSSDTTQPVEEETVEE